MIDRDVITSRLSKIREALALLRQVLAVSQEEYARNADNYLRGERLMEIIAQSMIDIGAHIVSASGFGKPQDFGELADILVREGVVRSELQHPLHGIFALRNILVHDYLVLDRVRFYREVKKGIADVETFCGDIAGLLDTRATDAES